MRQSSRDVNEILKKHREENGDLDFSPRNGLFGNPCNPTNNNILEFSEEEYQRKLKLLKEPDAN